MKHITFSNEELALIDKFADCEVDYKTGGVIHKLLLIQKAWCILRGEMNHDMSRESSLQRKNVVEYMNRIELDLKKGRL